MSVIEEIRSERAKQIGKGYTPDHDDQHERGEIALAAASYALRGVRETSDFPIYAGIGLAPLHASRNCGWIGLGGLIWPWVEEFPYDKTRRERLIIAAALLVAEIERLDRTEQANYDPARDPCNQPENIR